MDNTSLEESAKSLGFSVKHAEGNTSIQIEAPVGSGRLLEGKTAKDGKGFLILGGVAISEPRIAAFERAPAGLKRKAVSDVGSYLSLFDVEYNYDYYKDVPRAISLAIRWNPEEGSECLQRRIAGLLRVKEGVLHKLRFWTAEIEAVGATMSITKNRNEGIRGPASGASPADVQEHES